MVENVYKAPDSNIIIPNEYGDPPELWNPDAAGGWSLLFTPIFGSILVRKNWLALGEEKLANKSKIWTIFGVVLLIPSAFIPLIGFIFIVTWYFASQKPQTKFIKSRWGKEYPKRKWSKPLLIALPVWVLYVILLLLLMASIASV